MLLALGVGNECQHRVVGGEVVRGGVNGGGAGGVGVDVEDVAVGAAEAVLAVAVVLKVPAGGGQRRGISLLGEMRRTSGRCGDRCGDGGVRC